MNCSACFGAIIETEDHLHCTQGSCNKLYHVLCTGQKPTISERSNWICPECRSAAKKGGDNSSTPVGKSRDPNVTHRKKVSSASTNITREDHLGDELQPEAYILKFISLSEKFDTVVERYETKLKNSVSIITSYETQLNRAVTIIADYDSKIKMYKSKMDKLLETLNKYEDNTTIGKGVALCSRCSSLHSAIPNDSQPQPEFAQVSSQQQEQPVSSASTKTKPGKASVSSGPKTKRSPLPIEVQCVSVRDKQQSIDFPELTATIAFSSQTEKVTDIPAKDKSSDAVELADSQPWVEVVKKKKSRRQESVCGTAGPSITFLKAVEARKYLHLWNMASSADEIRQYLKDLFPTANCTVDELTAKGDYRSYKLGIPAALYEKCYSVEVWPVNAKLRPWVNYRANQRANTTNAPTAHSQSFRSKPARGQTN